MATSADLCGLCFDEPVVGFCNSCSLRLGNKCFSNHTKVVLFNDHQVVPLKPTIKTGHVEMSIHDEKCQVHRTDSKSLYCGKHDVTICGRCVLSAHMACKDEIVDLHTAKVGERKAGELLSTLNKLEETINVLVASFDENVKLSDDCQERYAESIKEYRNKLNARLDKLQSIAENAGKSKHTQNRSKLDQVQEQCKQTKCFITEQRHLIQEMSQKKKEGELYVFSKRFEKKINEINLLVGRVWQNNHIDTYSFEENVKMRLALENDFNEIGRLDETCVDSEEVNEISKELEKIGKGNQTPSSKAGLPPASVQQRPVGNGNQSQVNPVVPPASVQQRPSPAYPAAPSKHKQRPQDEYQAPIEFTCDGCGYLQAIELGSDRCWLDHMEPTCPKCGMKNYVALWWMSKPEFT